jgi:sialate O-acetylesterase
MSLNTLYILLFYFCLSPPIGWSLELGDIFSNGMVLQQQCPVRIWGKAKAGSSVQLQISWSSETFSTSTDKEGKWQITVVTPTASFQEQEINLSDGLTSKKISAILIGEVWLCSGQSNMEMSFKGYPNQPIAGSKEVLEQASKYPSIRVFHLTKNIHIRPTEEVCGKWVYGNAEALSSCSALAYFFGKRLHEQLQVPIGLVQAAWDGSSIEGWLTEDLVKKYTDYDPEKMLKQRFNFMKPYLMYNGMIHPLQRYTFSGCIWYQGESNVDRPTTYLSKLEDMIELWRNSFQDSTLPFFIVEITPYNLHPSPESAMLREAQFKASQVIKECHTICTNDLVDSTEAGVLHPSNKWAIAERLSNSALKNVYKQVSICSKYTSYSTMHRDSNHLILTFKDADGDLRTFSHSKVNGEEIIGFEIAGGDQFFYPAKAFFVTDTKSAESRQIIVESEKVDNPVAVRYCYKAYQPGNIVNRCGLPLVPFRTDNWPPR